MRRERRTGLYHVSDTPAPESDTGTEWEGYALSDCQPATLDQFQSPCWVKQAGTMVSVPDVRGVRQQEDETAGWLELEPVYLAACALAAAFNGVVLDLDAPAGSEILQWADIRQPTTVQDETLSPHHQQEILLWEPIESEERP